MATKHADTERTVAILADTRDSLPEKDRNARTIVWTAVEDAVHAVMRFPDRERGWLKGACSMWAAAGVTLTEARQIAKAALMEGHKPEVTPEVFPSMDEDRALLVMDWLGFCRVEDDDSLQKAAFQLARGNAIPAIALFRPGAVPDRKTLNHIKLIASVAMRLGIKETYGVEIGPGGALIVEDVA